MANLDSLLPLVIGIAIGAAFAFAWFTRRGRQADVLEVGAPPPQQPVAPPRAVPASRPVETAAGGDRALELQDAGHRKIEVIKLVREWTGLGLKEALDLVQSAPAVILTGLGDAQAADYVARLQAIGARAAVR